MQQENKPTISLRTYPGKKLLSYLRNGDYAHAGEAESIIQVMNRFPKSKHRTILDVGCGLGGTASFIEENGWGDVVGIDIERESIEYAKHQYPSIEFYVADVVNAHTILSDRKFDLICLFNSFYAFNDKELALRSLSQVANLHAKLVIFDYVDPLEVGITPLFREGDNQTAPFKPIKLQSIKDTLHSCNWYLAEIIDVSDDYSRWYADLLDRLNNKKKFAIEKFGVDAFDKACKTYTEIYDAIITKNLGGVIIYAEKQS